MSNAKPPKQLDSSELRRWRFALRRPLALIFVVLTIGLFASQGFRIAGIDIATIDVPKIAAELRAWGAWTAVASILLMILHSVLPLPAEVITVANALIFGPALGATITWVGAMSGALLAYALARYLGASGTPLPLDPNFRSKIDRTRNRPMTLLALRLIPAISFNLINYALGLLGVGWWTFLWTTAIGILPMTIAISYYGGAMATAPLWVWIAIAIVLVIASVAAPLFSKRRR